MSQVSSYCPLCISRCGCIYTVESGELKAVAPNPAHPTGKHLCSKAHAAVDLLRHPGRILHPLKRSKPKGSTDPGWQRIGWDEALQTTATAMRQIAEQSGPEAMAFCVTTPSGTAVADGMQWIFRLANTFGSPNTVWTTHVCNWHRDFAPQLTFGSDIGMPEFAATGCLMLWGVNPPATWLAMAEQIELARQRGMRLIVVDPRNAGFARRADVWLRVKPGTDGVLALALAHQLIKNGSYDRDFALRYSTGAFLVREDNGQLLVLPDGEKTVWDEAQACAISAPPPGTGGNFSLSGRFEVATPSGVVACRPAFELFANRCADYPLARAAHLTGIPAGQIAQAAELLRNQGPVSFYGWAGLNQHDQATQTSRALHLLYALTGCIDAPGGNVFFSKPPVRNVMGKELLPPGQLTKALGAAERPLGPARHGWISEASLYRAILQQQPYAVRGLLSFGANLLATRADPRRGREALQALDFFAHADFFHSPMSRDADILFPVAMPWERKGLQAGFFIHQAAEARIQLRTAVVAPRGEARSDTDIAFELATRLGLQQHFFGGDAKAGLRHVLEPTGITPERLRDVPEGVMLPLQTRYRKFRDKGFATRSGRVEVYAEALQAIGQPPLPTFRENLPTLEFPLLLTCAKLADRCHSQHQQAHRAARGDQPPLIMLHPSVAAERDIAEDEMVSVQSPYGTMQARAKFDASLDAATVWAHYGWWQATPGLAEEMAANYAALMGPKSDPVSGSSLLRGQYCQVVKAPLNQPVKS